MARKRKSGQPTAPSAFRISADDKKDAKRAARLETQRTGREVGWTTLIADGGMAKVRRILRRADKIVLAVPVGE
jgi:hypothetical protein